MPLHFSKEGPRGREELISERLTEIERQFDSGEEEARREAVQSLARMLKEEELFPEERKRIIEILKRAANDPSFQVRREVARSVGLLDPVGDPEFRGLMELFFERD